MVPIPRLLILLLVTICTGLFSCQKAYDIDITVPTGGTQSGTAVFSVEGALNACPSPVLTGTYTVGAAATGNTVVITVDVSTIGTYSIATAAINGLTFSASGTFTEAGNQTITLTASGTPLAAGTSKFVPGTQGCTFSIDIAAVAPAEFTFAGAPDACTTPTVSGSYIVGLPLGTGNTVAIKATVTRAGAYSITTATTNGITFKASGVLALGDQTITLAGSGTPTATSTDNFTAGTGGCSFPITAVAPAPAAFTLSGAPAACASPVVNGAFALMVPANASNTVVLTADVTTIGIYTITTNTVNGITFSGSGYFATTGTGIPVTLTATGTPTAAGTSTFTPVAGASTCTFDVTIGAAPTGTYSCKIDGVAFTFEVDPHASLADPLGGAYLYMDGLETMPNGGYIPEFEMDITNDDRSAVGVGSYNVDGFLKYLIDIDYAAVNPDNTVTRWVTTSSIFSPSPPFTIVVTSVTATRVKGTFSGTLTNLYDGSTKQKIVTEGTFDLPIE